MSTFREKLNYLEREVKCVKKANTVGFILLCVALLLMLITLSGCGPSVQELAKKHNWSQPTVNRIEDGRITTGFNKEQVKAAWGNPTDINYTTLQDKTKEQWVYGDGYNRRYVYFVNGKVTAIQH